MAKSGSKPPGVVALADPVSAIPKLYPAEFAHIRDLAKRRFGLDLRDGKEDLVSARLARAVREGKHASFAAYLHAVEADRSGDSLIHLINALTTNHTSFYREPEHFRFLTNEILSQRRPGSSLRIWCAASSTGEEPYTIVCTVADAWAKQIQGLRLLATDISTRVLDTARRAIYPAASLATAPLHWKQSYFQPDTGAFVRVRPELTTRVEFRRLNLIESFPFNERFDLILCRNVMIYFDKATQQSLVERLAAHLEPGGHLFVGHSESLAGIEHPLTYVRPAIYSNVPAKRRSQ